MLSAINIFCRNIGHFCIIQNITFVQYIDTSVLIGPHEHDMENILDTLNIQVIKIYKFRHLPYLETLGIQLYGNVRRLL